MDYAKEYDRMVEQSNKQLATITEQAARIKALEDALRVCRDALETHLDDTRFTSNAYEAHRRAVVTINELIGE